MVSPTTYAWCPPPPVIVTIFMQVPVGRTSYKAGLPVKLLDVLPRVIFVE